MRAKIIVFLIAMLTFTVSDAQSFDEDIKILFELDGSLESFHNVGVEMLNIFKENPISDESLRFLTEFENELLNIELDQLIDMLLPIYKEHFTHEEIKALIEFYESDIGKAMVEKEPQIIKESMSIGKAWGLDLALKIETRLKEEDKEEDNQENPFESYTITTTTQSSELSRNPDSFDSMFMDEIEENYYIEKDSSYIRENIIGKWAFNLAYRTNGKVVNYQKSTYEFYDDDTFLLIEESDSLFGKWSIKEKEAAKIKLTYDEPHMMIKDPDVLSNLSDEMIEAITISSNILSICDLQADDLILITKFPVESEEEFGFPNYRIVFLNYKKTE